MRKLQRSTFIFLLSLLWWLRFIVFLPEPHSTIECAVRGLFRSAAQNHPTEPRYREERVNVPSLIPRLSWNTKDTYRHSSHERISRPSFSKSFSNGEVERILFPVLCYVSRVTISEDETRNDAPKYVKGDLLSSASRLARRA